MYGLLKHACMIGVAVWYHVCNFLLWLRGKLTSLATCAAPFAGCLTFRRQLVGQRHCVTFAMCMCRSAPLSSAERLTHQSEHVSVVQAEAAEAAPTASNLPGAGLKAGAAKGAEADAAADKAASGRKLLESLLSAATLEELQRRRLAQTEASLSLKCQDLVLLAEPTDAFARYQTSLSASTVSAQVESLEAKLGLAPGTLTSPNDKGLTLTGWTAVFGLVAITVVTIAGAVFAYRRYKGLDKHSGYTMVKKAKGKQLQPSSPASS